MVTDGCWGVARERERLMLCAGTREAYVVHQANVPSGGTRTDLDLDAFLGRAFGSPQRDALLRLIGTLVDEDCAANAPRP
jgi:hypothetical protein